MFEVQAKAMKNRHIIAVDGGGTRSRVALAGCDGTVLSQIEGGFANLTSDFETSRINIETAIGDAYEAAQVPADSLQRDVAVLGIAGANFGDFAARLAGAFDFAKIHVVSDREIAIAGVLGQADGTLAQMGTGSFFVSQCQGRTKQIGGWGLQLADECSGAWLGRELLRHVMKANDGLIGETDLTREMMQRFGSQPGNIVLFAKTATPQDFGQLAPEIFAAQMAGDTVANGIIGTAIADLRRILIALDAAETGRIFLCGSVGERLKELLADDVADEFDDDLAPLISSPDGDGLHGAIALGCDLIKATWPDEAV